MSSHAQGSLIVSNGQAALPAVQKGEDAERRDGAVPPAGLLMTVEDVATLWFGEVGRGGSASSNCQKIRRLIPDVLPARRIGNRWYVNRATAETWTKTADSAAVMAHPATGVLA